MRFLPAAADPGVSMIFPVLEQYIPQSRLPKKLIVHDPWDLLAGDGHSRSNNDTWDEQVRKSPGCVYTYELRLSDKPAKAKRRKDDEEDLAEGNRT